MKINIKNIYCLSCEKYVKTCLNKLGYDITNISHCEVTIDSQISDFTLAELDAQLRAVGMEILHESKDIMIEKVKSVMRGVIKENMDPLKINLSDYLSEKLNYNYSYISNLFSKTEGETIRDFGIKLRIEQAKRMLLHEGLDLVEVANSLNYSSPAHLAAQFKKITGMTTSEFKRKHQENVDAELALSRKAA